METTARMFRQSDIRGAVPDDIDAAWAYRLGKTLAKTISVTSFGVGFDTRATSPELAEALRLGLADQGGEVVDLGLCPTEVIAFAVASGQVAFGIMVTASHNPEPDNGFKLFPERQLEVALKPLLASLRQALTSYSDGFLANRSQSPGRRLDLIPQYVEYVANLVDLNWSNGAIALNGLNGTASLVAEPLAERLGLTVQWCPQLTAGLPPEGPDPVKPRLLGQTGQFTQALGAALGVAWDGDCDRCVFLDERGNGVPSPYTMAMMADYFLAGSTDQHVVHDSKLVLSIEKAIKRHQAASTRVGTGSGHMRAAMQRTDAIYGGESSAHHYFGKIQGFDSGMLSWLTMLDLLSKSDRPLSQLASDYRSEVVVLPEISVGVDAPDRFLEALDAHLSPDLVKADFEVGRAYYLQDGIRFSLNPSTTEPLMRLNFESTGSDEALLQRAESILGAVWPYQNNPELAKPALVPA